MIAWLEKQGEQKSQGKSVLEVWKDMRFEVYQQASGNRHEANHSDDSTKMFSLTDIDEIFEKVAEKQGEQKPTNKIKPRFKVGDYIINEHGFVMQIDGIDNNMYIYHVLDNINKKLTYDITKTDKSCHLWTLKDAKDGDVLCYKDEVFILKNYVLFHKIVYHCCYDGENFIPHSIYSLTKDDFNKIHPATKEALNQLDKAMTTAGYTFDFEKKELKKIDARENLVLDGDLMQADCMMIEYKSLWSEEDEMMLTLCASSVQTRYNDGLLTCNEYEQASLWLKSLKERYTWKPSDEQMRELGIVATGMGWFNKDVLSGLLEQLKKLRGE